MKYTDLGDLIDRDPKTISRTVKGKERMEHPKVNNDVMYAIDAFMKDDIADDMDEMPF